ncbi:MAG: PH domain-containing protein [Candidatus Edwardsbacteria bacterium]|nr:PH domain-containing protein [Candidatus Edwardsbacteria bacterium]
MMDLNPNYSFSRQRPDETVLAVIRKHWYILAIRITWSTLAVILVIIALILAQQLSLAIAQGWKLVITYTVVVAVWLLYMVYEYHDWWEDKLIITDQRILSVDRQGMFSRSVTELDLLELQDANYVIQGFIGTIFKFGAIALESASDKIDIYMDHIHDPKQIQELITRLAKQAKKEN